MLPTYDKAPQPGDVPASIPAHLQLTALDRPSGALIEVTLSAIKAWYGGWHDNLTVRSAVRTAMADPGLGVKCASVGGKHRGIEG